MQNLRVLTLGDMQPEGDPDEEDTRFVHRTHTTQLVKIIDGASEDLTSRGDIAESSLIEATAPEDSNKNGIVGAVLSEIENSDLMIIDVSTESPSVIYELGAVNALGLPYILVTSSSTLPFYLTQARSILNFVFADAFDPAEASHLELRNRLLRNYQSLDGTEASESRFSEYFGGFPIVNISGPISAATGYQANFINRFAAQDHGILSKRVTWGKSAPDGGSIIPVATVRPQHLVVILPDPSKYSDYSQARAAFEETMETVGLPLESVAVMEGEGDNLRLGMGVLILRDHPEIVLDIPRTMYPLMKSPRILTALANGGRFSDKQVRERTLRRLFKDFKTGLTWNLGLAASQGSDAPWSRVHVVSEDDMVQEIRELLD